MAEQTTDRDDADEDRLRVPDIETFADYAIHYAKQSGPRDWDGVRIYNIVFSDGLKITACSKSPISLKNCLRVNEDGMLEPRMLEIKAPYYQCFRLDEVVAVVEILPGEILGAMNEPKEPT